jgi:TfoX/Sxy family transcriptional regulator of competence genes
MPYSARLEEKIDAAARRWKSVEKRRMFGGVCWLIKGNMAFGIWKDFLVVRMDREAAETWLTDRNVLPFDVTGRPMAGWIMVKEAGWRSAPALATWIGRGKKFALSLPENKGKGTAKAAKTLREYRR